MKLPHTRPSAWGSFASRACHGSSQSLLESLQNVGIQRDNIESCAQALTGTRCRRSHKPASKAIDRAPAAAGTTGTSALSAAHKAEDNKRPAQISARSWP